MCPTATPSTKKLLLLHSLPSSPELGYIFFIVCFSILPWTSAQFISDGVYGDLLLHLSLSDAARLENLIFIFLPSQVLPLFSWGVLFVSHYSDFPLVLPLLLVKFIKLYICSLH